MTRKRVNNAKTNNRTSNAWNNGVPDSTSGSLYRTGSNDSGISSDASSAASASSNSPSTSEEYYSAEEDPQDDQSYGNQLQQFQQQLQPQQPRPSQAPSTQQQSRHPEGNRDNQQRQHSNHRQRRNSRTPNYTYDGFSNSVPVQPQAMYREAVMKSWNQQQYPQQYPTSNPNNRQMKPQGSSPFRERRLILSNPETYQPDLSRCGDPNFYHEDGNRYPGRHPTNYFSGSIVQIEKNIISGPHTGVLDDFVRILKRSLNWGTDSNIDMPSFQNYWRRLNNLHVRPADNEKFPDLIKLKCYLEMAMTIFAATEGNFFGNKPLQTSTKPTKMKPVSNVPGRQIMFLKTSSKAKISSVFQTPFSQTTMQSQHHSRQASQQTMPQNKTIERLPSDVIAQLFKAIETLPARAKLMHLSPLISKNIFKTCRTISLREQNHRSELWDYIKNQTILPADERRYQQTRLLFQTAILPNVEKMYVCFGSTWVHFLMLISGFELNLKRLTLHIAPFDFWDDDHPLLKNAPWKPKMENEEMFITTILKNVETTLEHLTVYNLRHIPPSCIALFVDFINIHGSNLKSLTLESIHPVTFPFPGLTKFEKLEYLNLILRTPHCLKEFDQKIFESLNMEKIKSLQLMIKVPDVDLNPLPIWIQRLDKLTHLSIGLKFGRDILDEPEEYFRDLEKRIQDVAKSLKRLTKLKVLKIHVRCRRYIDSSYNAPGILELADAILRTNLPSVQKLYILLPETILPSKTISLNPVFPIETLTVDFVNNRSLGLYEWWFRNVFDNNTQKPIVSLKKLSLRDIFGVCGLIFNDIKKFFPNLERLEIEIKKRCIVRETEQLLEPHDVVDLMDMLRELQNLQIFCLSGEPVFHVIRKPNEVIDDWTHFTKIINLFHERAVARPTKLFVLKIQCDKLIRRVAGHSQEPELLKAIEGTKTCKNLHLY